MKLKISDVRIHWPNHLKPFEGLFGFDSELDYYKGTIFRFPLLTTSHSHFAKIERRKAQDVQKLLGTYFEDARVSLLFLKRIRSIKFVDSGCEKPIWEVSVERERVSESQAIEHVKVKGRNDTTEGGSLSALENEWCVALGNAGGDSVPEELVGLQRQHRLAPRCGIAADISKHRGDWQSRLFMDLPLVGVQLDLPVHVSVVSTFSFESINYDNSLL